MIKKEFRLNKKKFFFLVAVCGLVMFLGSSIYGVILMKGVPQKIGLKDVEYSSFTKKLCAECHDSPTVDTHHNTKNAIEGNCVACHTASSKPGEVGVFLSRDCMVCHTKSPHHKTKAALNKECTTCHDSPGLGEYTMKEPPYKPSKVTPSSRSCANCHAKGVVDGVNVVGMKDTHHGISLAGGCNVCHDENDKNSGNIRTCERCHNVKAIHEVLPHIEKTACAGCHGDNIAPASAKPAEKPEEVKK